MITSVTIEAALRRVLPPELHSRLAGLAAILQAAATGAISADTAQSQLAREPGLLAVLQALAGQQARAGGTLLSFGEEGQLGDVSINDVAGGNLLKLTVNNYYGSVAPTEQAALPPKPLAASERPTWELAASPKYSLADENATDDMSVSFVAGPPILHPRAFFGREAIVRRIFGMLKRPPLQNTVVIGPRRSGKTSLLHLLRSITRTPVEQLRSDQRNDWLARPERYQWVMLDFQDVRLGRKEGVLRALLAGMGLRAPEPCTLDRAMDVISDGPCRPTVILLDEVGKALQSYPDLDDDLWESLRSLGPQVGGNLGFVLASHSAPTALAHDSGHSSPFFNIFGYTATLGPFTEVEARALIASSPVPFAEDDIAWIIEQSGRWPILLQVFCRERLMSLEDGEGPESWREAALVQVAEIKHMFEEKRGA